MSHPQLDNLARIGKLKTEPASDGELRGLVRSGRGAWTTRRARRRGRTSLSRLPSPLDIRRVPGNAP